MKWKKFLLQGGTASLLSIIACLIYQEIYTHTFETDFAAVLNITGIVGASILGCLLISLGYVLIEKWNKSQWIGIFNLVVTGLSFASVISPLATTLPLDMESPELFPGLAIPMHFFPALAFFTIVPFFNEKKQ
ncbi:hypothetical protein [Parapedobacter koreensis]|uniref:Uncharacterized protein n=1 Tax=Parapedobacter koreensis TaxID=332977 RepID=A0A1H7LTU6_9SPHI|nr:hypothetical protein [Parapedobacter koreensis]SEL02360.1 hypothetical protein SAMN05421740_103267 [Parapedobacter koreensis]